MWYYPSVFALGKRDVIGAWLMCLVVAAVFFGWSAIGSTTPDRSAAVAASGPSPHTTAGKCA
jgi:hypothetical protein